MKINKTIEKICELYSENIKEHGLSSKSVGWSNSADHKLRFEKLLPNVNLNSIKTLNDLGAGYGSVLDYLSSKKFNLEKYFAYDISADMLANINTLKYPSTKIEKFQEPKISTKADFTITSGIFNVNFSESNEAWLEYILETLNNINVFSNHGFSFNMLTSYVDFKEEHLYYADPMFFFDFCKNNFSKYVSLSHDYPLWEWTIVVNK